MTRIRFENLPSKNTPITADNLNKLNNVVISSSEPTTGEKVWIQKGKNLINLEQLGNYNLNETTGIVENNDTRLATPYISLKKGTYTISCNLARFAYVIYNNDKSFNSFVSWQTFPSQITINNDCYVRVEIIKDYDGAETISKNDITYLQLECGEVATTYEPYIPKKIYTKNDNGDYEEFNEENNISSIILTFNDDYIYSTDRSYHCFRMGKTVFLQIYHMGFIQSIGHGEVLISGLPAPTQDTVIYFYGGLSAKGETVRCILNMEGKLQTHYTHPPSTGNSSDYQFSGFVVYETNE